MAATRNKPVILIIGVDFHGPPEEEKKCNQWYTEVHAPFVFQSKGVNKAVRYHRVEQPHNTKAPKYLAIYQFKNREALEEWYAGPEFKAILAQRKGVWPDECFETPWRVVYEPIKEWEK
jgi:uncharacterized protein (DUF1330 family)